MACVGSGTLQQAFVTILHRKGLHVDSFFSQALTIPETRMRSRSPLCQTHCYLCRTNSRTVRSDRPGSTLRFVEFCVIPSIILLTDLCDCSQALFTEAPVDTSLYSLYLHQNYPLFCNDVDECASIMETLSGADSLRTDEDMVRLSRPTRLAIVLSLIPVLLF